MPVVTIDARDGFAPQPRGWGNYARELVGALRAGAAARAGVDLEVIERAGAGPEVAWEQAGLSWRLRRTGAGLVHSPNCFLPLVRPCPGVVTIHDLAFEAHPEDFSLRTGTKFRWITPRAARSAERVICVSSFTRDDVVTRYGVDPDRVRVIPNAPALPIGDAPAPPGPYLLAVGDLRAKKNLRRLVRAFRGLHEAGELDGCRLVLAGADTGEGEALGVQAGGAPVELTGYVDDARLDALIRGAAALVHPSLYEGFGLVVVEAMARRCPVICARATALPETAGDAAAYFDPLDEDDLAAVIGELLGDGARRAELAERGRARAAELSWADTARRTAAVYRELL